MSDVKGPLVGPGSQPFDSDGGVLDYMEMPSSMATFAMPEIPEPEDTEGMEAAKAVLGEVLKALQTQKAYDPAVVFELSGLDKENLGLVNQVLGEGEVAIVAGPQIQSQESVLAGVWRVHFLSEEGALAKDVIEVGAYPSSVKKVVFEQAQDQVPPLDDKLPDGVLNAPAVLTEIADKVAGYQPGQEAHAINLTLLPQTEQDLEYLTQKLGRGSTVILSRGYGNCRISSTNTNNVWWVQYFNSQDALILNSIEIVDMPDVVPAAQEDIEESADRLGEILEVYR